jgi:hypothetical protein
MTTASLTSECGLRPCARLGLRLGLVLPLCLCQCAHPEKKPGVADKAAPQVEWYIASQDPLTYCPKGHALPAGKSSEFSTFVYLADRRTRFYIPPKAMAPYRQALQLRQESTTTSQRVFASSHNTMEWVGRRILQVSATAVLGAIFGAGQASGGGLNELFADMWSY